jgi:hypothetical protein
VREIDRCITDLIEWLQAIPDKADDE